MPHNQWYIGVPRRHLMKLIDDVLVFMLFYAMMMFQFAKWLEIIPVSSSD